MAEKLDRIDRGPLTAGSGGGSLPRSMTGAPTLGEKRAAQPSQFTLPKAAPQYEIWSRRLGKKVGTATSLNSARRVVDRRDNEYGAYDHYHKKIGD